MHTRYYMRVYIRFYFIQSNIIQIRISDILYTNVLSYESKLNILLLVKIIQYSKLFVYLFL